MVARSACDAEDRRVNSENYLNSSERGSSMTSTPGCRTKARAALELGGFLAVNLLVLEAAGPLLAQEEVNGVIAGRVTDPRGQPQWVMVQLLSPGDILVDQSYTDSNGSFAFSNLRNGVFYITVE